MQRIHVMGAPGAGVSTLGRHIAGRLGLPHFDTDDYYWFTDDELPYRRKRNPEHRLRLLLSDLAQTENWVLSGSLFGWGDALIPQFDMVIYLWADVETRLERIRARETARYGAHRIEAGGDLHLVFEKFCAWAARYDEASDNIRSRDQELQRLALLPCPVVRYQGGFEEFPIETLVTKYLDF